MIQFFNTISPVDRSNFQARELQMCNPYIATRKSNQNIKNFSQVNIGDNDCIQRHYEEAHSLTREPQIIKSHTQIIKFNEARPKTDLNRTLQNSSNRSEIDIRQYKTLGYEDDETRSIKSSQSQTKPRLSFALSNNSLVQKIKDLQASTQNKKLNYDNINKSYNSTPNKPRPRVAQNTIDLLYE